MLADTDNVRIREIRALLTPDEVTAETIRRRWKKIANMRGALVFPDALKAVGATFDALKRRAGL